MARNLLAALIFVFSSAALADETIRVYQLDGSIHCQEATVTTPAQAGEILEQAGIKVMSAESRSVPFGVSSACGTPTGQANVLVVDADNWKMMAKRRPDAHGFGVWVFDQSTVEIYKYDGSLQCERGKEIALEDMAKELTENGIEVKSSRKGSDGRMHIAMCGASTGRLNVYSIPAESLPRARELGFELLVTRQMTQDISGPASRRRGPAIMSRTPPREPGSVAGKPIPKLW